MSLQLVVFDLAGTTVEDPGSVNLCLRSALEQAGVTVDSSAVDRVMGLPKPEAIRCLLETAGRSEALGQVDAIHQDFQNRMRLYYRDDPSVRSVPGVEDLFARLKAAGVRIGLDTGFDHTITKVILDRLGWIEKGLVDAHVSSDQVAVGRPEPLMIRHLMEATGVTQPDSVAKVGDAPADLLEGKNAGCRWIIGVTWGTHTRKQLEVWPHTHLVESVEALEAVLQEDPAQPMKQANR
ncbi:MAG TPA: HAD hydrolase-like protein [Isosphaeraceae bacterium]|nr:HAD hydrolase-like protein [Isosphaeraceae bacterium]